MHKCKRIKSLQTRIKNIKEEIKYNRGGCTCYDCEVENAKQKKKIKSLKAKLKLLSETSVAYFE